MSGLEDLRLDRKRSAVLVVDVQERLVAAMPADRAPGMLKAVRTLIEGATVLGVPVLATEQYPRGLGPTVAALREVLPAGAAPLEKTAFSCCGDPRILEALRAAGRDQWIVCGMEAHVCVFQTVRDLRGQGWTVQVPRDAVLSRTADGLAAGLDLALAAGAVVTCVESVLFDLLGVAGTPEFKAVSALVK